MLMIHFGLKLPDLSRVLVFSLTGSICFSEPIFSLHPLAGRQDLVAPSPISGAWMVLSVGWNHGAITQRCRVRVGGSEKLNLESDIRQQYLEVSIPLRVSS